MDEQGSGSRLVRLTADRGAVPLWDTDEPEALSWEGLPLSARLQAELRSGPTASTPGWPRDSGGRRAAASTVWEADGRRLATWLQSELGTGYRVEYDAP